MRAYAQQQEIADNKEKYFLDHYRKNLRQENPDRRKIAWAKNSKACL